MSRYFDLTQSRQPIRRNRVESMVRKYLGKAGMVNSMQVIGTLDKETATLQRTEIEQDLTDNIMGLVNGEQS